jgi:hypothetical protein
MHVPNVQRETPVCLNIKVLPEPETYIYRLNNSFYYFLVFVIMLESKTGSESFKSARMPFCLPFKSGWRHKMRFIESIPQEYKQRPGKK